MNNIISQRIVVVAVISNTPSGSDQVYKMREDLVVYHEEDKQCRDPITGVSCTERQVTFRNLDETSRHI